jgi:DNA-binding transcriptional LysR family regulator
MKRFDLNLLYAFDALSRTGSVKAAADLLHLSAPAMSHTLARLRETTGDPLLVRSGRKLVPTPRALAMAEATRDLVARAQAILAPTRDGGAWATAAREFVVVAPDELAVAQGARLLEAIRSKMPHASLEFLPAVGSSFERWRQAAVDLEIRPEGPLPPEVRMEVLHAQRAVVVMRRSHPLAKQKLTLTRYVQALHVGLSTGSELDTLVDQALADAGAARTAVLRLATPYAALSAASRSDLLATIQESLAQAVSRPLGLVCAPLPFRIADLRIVQAWHPRMEQDPQHAWLRACVRSVLGKDV